MPELVWENKKFESQKVQIITLVSDQIPNQNGGKANLSQLWIVQASIHQNWLT